MPFALTILKEDHKKYIKNNKNIESNFMTIAFETKKNILIILKLDVIIMIKQSKTTNLIKKTQSKLL